MTKRNRAASTDEDHWSIGEVLSLIQDEFPDVTISKIRFLESQGLVSPERTPSGYRRFYQGDFEQLRWILGQQRDHYLPLKVIRARLESGDLDGENEVDAAPALPLGGLEPASKHAAPRTGKPLAKPELPVEESGKTTKSGNSKKSGSASEPGDVSGSSDESQTELGVHPGNSSGKSPDNVVVSVADATTVTDRRGKGMSESQVNSAMTKDELAEASGCSLETLSELERFGLVSGRSIGPTVLYDGEALLVAKLAAQFTDHGLEPRHLRTFKMDAEREVGLMTQIVGPAMRRRDADVRRESLSALEEMVELSNRLREILVRQLVREQLPSQRG